MSLRESLKIIILTPYPEDTAPGQRFRFEQYIGFLRHKGHVVRYYSFLTHSAYANFYQLTGYRKLLAVISGYIRTVFHVFKSIRADFVFIYREATLGGPPVFEFLLAKVFGRKIIYDFDDAIWLTDNEAEGRLERWLRWRSKVKHICRWSYRISCGNNYLANYARQFNASVVVNPTTIDTENLHNPVRINCKRQPEQLIIGWTGSHSTLKYLNQLLPVLQQIEHEFYYVKFLVIANRDPKLQLPRYFFVPWQKETEADDLACIDIGIMPLPDDEWTRGKCGFKALQYMAMEIPCIASPVGVNSEIIEHGKNGFLAASAGDWIKYLRLLITDESLRKKIGKAGRETVISRYSVKANSDLFLSLFS